MKRISKVLIIVGIIFLVTLSFMIGKNKGENEVYEEENVPEISHKDLLSMMIEQNAGMGDYELETRSSWPTQDEGYVFNKKLSKCKNGSKVSWDNENNVVLFEGTSIDKCYVYFDKYNPNILANYIKNMFTGTQGENGLYYHDSTLENGANDNSYRYAGASASVNNFVCFGSDEETCSNDNLYRIIGVFDDKVKLVKYDYATTTLLGTDGDYGGTGSGVSLDSSKYKGSLAMSSVGTYYWSYKNYITSYDETGYYNNWSYSELRKTNLNTNFLTNIGSKWADMIATTDWIVGGYASSDVTPQTMYTNEITAPSTKVTSTSNDKISLIYASDYGFSADPSAWTTNLSAYNDVSSKNWMHMGLTELTLGRSSASDKYSFFIKLGGKVLVNENINGHAWTVRPTFYLASNVLYDTGDGTSENPIRLS